MTNFVKMCLAMRRIHIWACVLLLLGVVSCKKDSAFEREIAGANSAGRTQPERSDSGVDRHVMILVAAGFNSLATYLSDDLSEVESGYIPEGNYYNSDALVILSRIAPSVGRYAQLSAPVLYKLYKDRSGELQRDTLMVWDEDVQLTRKETIAEALALVQQEVPSPNYGMVVSSHATGWLPEGYYDNPEKYERTTLPRLQSIGRDDGVSSAVEMELSEWVDAIPMHLDYLLLDACLCGGVEVAYAFHEKADIIGFSPTEVLADGYNYLTITEHLLRDEPDPVGVCQEYFERYNAMTGDMRSATVTAVDLREIDSLVEVCRDLFEKYRDALDTLDGSSVQGYFRYNLHYFYDLRDILTQAGASEEDLSRLNAALDSCLLYQAATDYFLTIPLRRVCGLSMYLPSMGTDFLDSFYRNEIDWNTATELVK